MFETDDLSELMAPIMDIQFDSNHSTYATSSPSTSSGESRDKMKSSKNDSGKRGREEREKTHSRKKMKSSQESQELEFSEDSQQEQLIQMPLFALGPDVRGHYNYLGHVKGTTTVVLTCKYCQEEKRGKGKEKYNFIRHVQLVHSDKLQGAQPSKKQTKLYSNTEIRQRNMPKISRSSALQTLFNKCLLDLIAVDGLPFNLTEGIAWKNFMNFLRPEINIPSRATISRNLTREINEKIIPELNKEFRSIDDEALHLSLDIWTSRSHESVLGVKGHYIDSNWNLKSKTLGFLSFPQKHTGENILEKIEELLAARELQPTKIGTVMADNASNITRAFNLMDSFDVSWKTVHQPLNVTQEVSSAKEDSDWTNDDEFEIDSEDELDEVDEDCSPLHVEFENKWPRLRCCAHTLQLAVNTALRKDKNANNIMKSVEKVVSFFRRSTYRASKLKEKTQKTLILPGKTRWNSLLFAMERLCEDEVFSAVEELVEEHNSSFPSTSRTATKHRFTATLNREHLLTLCALLKPIADATNTLQANDVTSSLVILSIVNAYISIYQNSRVGIFAVFRDVILCEMEIRFQETVQNETFIMASILHPRIKLRPFEGLQNIALNTLSLPSYMEAKQIINAKFAHHHHPVSQRAESSSHPVSQSLLETSHTSNEELKIISIAPASDMFQLLDQFCPASTTLEKNELEKYLEEPVQQIEPIEYWKKREKCFPILSKLAKFYLAVPATSGDVERLFSIAGALKRSRRARMKIGTVEKLLFLRENRLNILRSNNVIE